MTTEEGNVPLLSTKQTKDSETFDVDQQYTRRDSVLDKGDKKPTVSRVWQGRESLSQTGICGKFWFSWSQPALKAANREQLQIE